jgi:hypothetical protein
MVFITSILLSTSPPDPLFYQGEGEEVKRGEAPL